MITDHQTTEGKPHLFTATEFTTLFVPRCGRKQVAVQPDFYFVLGQVAAIIIVKTNRAN